MSTPSNIPYYALRVDRLLGGLSVQEVQQFESGSHDCLLWQFSKMNRKEWVQGLQEHYFGVEAEIVYHPKHPERALYAVYRKEAQCDFHLDRLKERVHLPLGEDFLKFCGNTNQITVDQLEEDYGRCHKERFSTVHRRSSNQAIREVQCEITDVFLNLYRVV